MSATLLYTQLSRTIISADFDPDDDEILNDASKSLMKLRQLLLCRACRELSYEPHSPEFCQHLVCSECFERRHAHNPGCKWCRSLDDFRPNQQSEMLIDSYKNLCSILVDFLHDGDADDSGYSIVKRRLLNFLVDGVGYLDPGELKTEIDVSVQPSSKRGADDKKKIDATSEQTRNTGDVEGVCSKCLCDCKLKQAFNATKKQEIEATVSPVEIKQAESSDNCKLTFKDIERNSEELTDTVSSTVPDTLPDLSNGPERLAQIQNKDGAFDEANLEVSQSEEEIVEEEEEDVVPINNDSPRIRSDTADESSGLEGMRRLVDTSRFYKSLSLSLKKRKDRNIFEKFGLALSPSLDSNQNSTDESDILKDTIKKLKTKRKHLKGAIYSTQQKKQLPSNEKPKLMPIKIRMKKIKSESDDASYQVHYSSTETLETVTVPNKLFTKKTKKSPKKSKKRKLSESSDADDHLSATIIDSSIESASSGHGKPRRTSQRRRQSVIETDVLTISDSMDSDSSDFEPNPVFKKVRKVIPPKEERDICGCGSGSNIKYFTDICRRLRCPCYSQERPCINCKCRFCSNPYVVNDENSNKNSSSDSEMDQPLAAIVKEEALTDVDVEVV